jgi:tRNA threonylcarbamoyladenosine biosynthesis protein TsaE
MVYHVDLYRISGESELPFLGWSDLRDGLMLIEWPERVPELRDQADLSISLDFADDGRNARITAITERASRLPVLGAAARVP